jgi:hypothetical protein
LFLSRICHLCEPAAGIFTVGLQPLIDLNLASLDAGADQYSTAEKPHEENEENEIYDRDWSGCDE